MTVSSSHLGTLIFCAILQSRSEAGSASSVYSSCTGRGITAWNRNVEIIKLEIESWLSSMISVSFNTNISDNIYSMYYHPDSDDDDDFLKHFFQKEIDTDTENLRKTIG